MILNSDAHMLVHLGKVHPTTGACAMWTGNLGDEDKRWTFSMSEAVILDPDELFRCWKLIGGDTNVVNRRLKVNVEYADSPPLRPIMKGHGSPADRGDADAYYWRMPVPHMMIKNHREENLSVIERALYMEAYNDCDEKKDYS